ncbi:MAG: hypothetical protein ABJH45_18865 [Paracoccaceae bacterium]
MPTIMIAMPTSGYVRTETMVALIGLTQGLRERGIAFAIKTFEGSDIVMSRNALMSQFFTDITFSHTLLIDGDMSFEPTVVFRLLEFGAAFTCAAYPQRKLSLEKLRRLIENDATDSDRDRDRERTPTQDLLAKALSYNVQKRLNHVEPWQSKYHDGFRTVPGAGTGLMLIARTVPETMVAKGVAPARPRHDGLPLYAGAKFHDFFSHVTDPKGSLIYGEDQSFCRRWVEGCSGDIWCDETAVIVHHGHFPFRGNFSLHDN